VVGPLGFERALNLDAVVKAVDFQPAKNGNFVLPKEIANTSNTAEEQ
jgi:hypothetical protein